MKQQTHRQTGFSLVELMVALVLGLLLIGGTLTVFTGGVRSSQFNTALATMQANARFALDIMSNDVRMAGFQGCAEFVGASLQISTNATPTTNFNDTAISGAEIAAGGWLPAPPPSYTTPTAFGVPVIGTHALFVQYADSPGYLLQANMTGRSSDITVTDNGARFPIEDGDLAIMSDCNSADLFTVDTVTGTTTKTIDPEDNLSKAYALMSATDQSVRLLPFVNGIYYIGDTKRTNKTGDELYSLYQQTYPYTAANPPIELVEGVDQLQLLFGILQPNGSTAFVGPNHADFVPNRITSVRVGLLLSSHEQFTEVDDTRIFTLANQTVSPNSGSAVGATYPADKRMRVPFSTTLSVRNRASLDN